MTGPGPGGPTPAWPPPAGPAAVQPWPPLFGTPVCTIRVGAPAADVIAALAGSLGAAGLRVRQDAGRIEVRTPTALVKNALGVLSGLVGGSGGDSFSSSAFVVAVTVADARGTELEAGMRSGGGGDLRTRVPAALTAALHALHARGASVEVGPWDRRGLRGKRYPTGGAGSSPA